MADLIRFHLDEHVDPAVANALRRAGSMSPPPMRLVRTKDDQAQLNFARAEGRIIVTRDRDFLRFAHGSEEHSGIAFYSANQSLREIIEGLILVYGVMSPAEMAGHIEYL